MKRSLACLTLLVSAASPALAGGDWYGGYYDDGYYEQREWYGYRGVYVDPYASYGVYIPYYGAYVAEEPAYPAHCEIKRKWRHGYYREKIDCDD